MNNLTIVTKLRFMAAIAPAILLLASAVIVGAFHYFGTMPWEIYENEYAAARAAEGMENALYKMDWGRGQPDGSQIVKDQQRGFISEIEIARQHIGSREQAERIEKIANDARPLFDALRTASPSDDSLEPRLRDLQGTVADLMSLDDAALIAVANSAESQSRTMIAITIVGLVAVPWICFVLIARLSGNLYTELKEMRRRVDALAEHEPASSGDTRALDESLTNLGFPKPNPMLTS
ncbi:MAG TPA: hypothetical protein VJX68_06505 [Candidatus Binatus sp.]|uniref:hypothetical protein n=1 Tax=Candidatus Binatus sp. TaxID=2811406 RepID=UPI002B4990F1|nr:hypothetical protein [Candidatus Binatus sp.]HKN12832.1 hypothetical protein [Candidatus Binatus sp.]